LTQIRLFFVHCCRCRYRFCLLRRIGLCRIVCTHLLVYYYPGPRLCVQSNPCSIQDVQVLQLIVGFYTVIQPSNKRLRRPSSSNARSQRGRGSGCQVVCSYADLRKGVRGMPPNLAQRVLGEAIWRLYNARKPFNGWGSAHTPLGSLQRSLDPQILQLAGRRLAVPF